VSGAQKSAQHYTIVDLNWPHYHVEPRGPGGAELFYDDLTLPEWVYGYLVIINKYDMDPRITADILKHMQLIMAQAIRFPWPLVSHFHKLVLRQMEQGHLNWGDAAAIKEIRDNMVYEPMPTAPRPYTRPQEMPRPARKGPDRYCAAYQSNTCKISGDHDTPEGWVKHICAYCQRQPGLSSPGYTHAEFECHRKLKDQQGLSTKNLESDAAR
jgi:hypothetical protein